MTPRYRLMPRARGDLADIAGHVHDTAGPLTAVRVVDAFRASFRMLGRNPNAGHPRLDLTDDPFVLFWPLHSWLIAYSRESGRVEILALVHGARNAPLVFECLSIDYPVGAEG